MKHISKINSCVVVVCLFIPHALSAGILRNSCEIVVSPNQTLPVAALAIFKKPGSAIMSCKTDGRGPILSELSSVKIAARDVCRFAARRIGEATANSSGDAQTSKPTYFMLLAAPPCPDQRDQRFVPTYDISPRAFGAANRSWLRASNSDAELTRTLARLRDDGRLWLDAERVDTLRKAISVHSLKLWSASTTLNTEEHSGTQIALFFRAQTARPNQYVVYTADALGGSRVVGISEARR